MKGALVATTTASVMRLLRPTRAGEPRPSQRVARRLPVFCLVPDAVHQRVGPIHTVAGHRHLRLSLRTHDGDVAHHFLGSLGTGSLWLGGVHLSVELKLDKRLAAEDEILAISTGHHMSQHVKSEHPRELRT